VQALAQPAHVQLTLFPDFVCKADELALDFDRWREVVLADPDGALTPLQRAALEALDAQLAAMSGSDKPFWEEDALADALEWGRVRQLAKDTLRAFGWAMAVPPKDRAVYVGNPD
jgi:hypothetical protein